jgi:excisionase family DNA binding protein
MRNDDGDFLTTAEVAKILNYSVAWVNKLAKSERLPVARKLPGHTGAYLFRRADVDALITGRAA